MNFLIGQRVINPKKGKRLAQWSYSATRQSRLLSSCEDYFVVSENLWESTKRMIYLVILKNTNQLNNFNLKVIKRSDTYFFTYLLWTVLKYSIQEVEDNILLKTILFLTKSLYFYNFWI